MNTKIIKLDINKKLYETISAKQGDTESRFLLFHIFDSSLPFDLREKSVRVYGIKPDDTKVFNDLVINDAEKGYCTLELTNQILAIAGLVKLELVIYNGNKKLSSIPFVLNVISSLNSDDAVVSTNEFTALMNGLAALSEYDIYKSNAKQVPGIKEEVSNLSSQLDTKANKKDVESLTKNKANSSDLEVERNRINNLVANAGNTDENSELLDLRIDNTGTNYGVSGESIRFSQDGKLLDYDSTALSLGYRKFLKLPFEYGSINGANGNNATDTVSIRTPSNSLISFNGDIKVINMNNTLYRWKWYVYSTDGDYESSRGWETNPNLLMKPDLSKKYRFQIATLDGSKINISDALKNIKIVNISDEMEVTLDNVINTMDYLVAIGAGNTPTFSKSGNTIKVVMPSTPLFYRDNSGKQIAKSIEEYYNKEFQISNDEVLLWNLNNNIINVQKVSQTRDKKNVVLLYNIYGNVQGGAFKSYYDNQEIFNKLNNSSTPNIEFISRQGEIGGYPENSLIGINFACKNGYNNVRVSVNLTADNIPVLFHDITINRLARNVDGSEITDAINIRDLTLEQVNSYDWGRISNKEELYGMNITTLEQFVRYAKYKGIKIRLELKQTYTSETVDIILNILLKYGMLPYTTFSSDMKNVLDLIYQKCKCVNFAFIGHFNNALIDKALAYKNENNSVSIDIYPADYELLTTNDLLYCKNKSVKIKLGSVGDLNNLYKWFETGIDELEVAYIGNPTDKILEYYNSNY